MYTDSDAFSVRIPKACLKEIHKEVLSDNDEPPRGRLFGAPHKKDTAAGRLGNSCSVSAGSHEGFYFSV